MLRKMLAALSVALVALLFTSPTALADNSDNTNETTYWQNYYGGDTVCYKDDSSKGTVSGSTVTLKDGGWSHLIVKGGAVDTGSGKGNAVYNNPSAGTAYATPTNGGDQAPDVSHWIVCGPPPFDWDWQYEAPTCSALVVVYPADLPGGQANDVNVKIKNLITDEVVTLNFHKGDGTWSGTKTFTFSDASNWPGWDYYAVTWVQVAGSNYHWSGSITCGNPPPVDVCKNIDGNQAEVPDGYYSNYGNCYHNPVDVCVNYEKVTMSWADYSALEVKPPLFDDSCHPPVDVCKNLSGMQTEVPAGFTKEGDNCFHNEVVCWLMDTYQGGAQPPSAGAPSTFPQTRVDCDDEVPCGMWVQKDWYHIGSWTDEEVWLNLGDTLEYSTHPEDSAIYVKHVFLYGGDCPPVPFCTIGELKYYEGDLLPTGYVWVGQGPCTPPVDVCENLDGLQLQVPAGWSVDDGYCFHDEVVCWLMDNYDGDGTPPAGSPSTFPQTRVDCDDEIPCGMWVQKDWYHIDSFTDEEVWLNLGDTLTWDGHPEDSAIYHHHQFIYGGDCPPVPFCTIGELKYYEGDPLPTGYVWTPQGLCTPPVDVCENLDGLQLQVPAGWSVDDGYCFHDEVVCWLMDNYDGDGTPPAGSPSTFPQTRVDCDDEIPCGMWVQKDWYHIDSFTDEEVWLNLGDTLTWDGHPEDSAIYHHHQFIYGGDCPPVPFCTIGELKYYEGDPLPTGYVWTPQGLCTPPVDVCENLDGLQLQVPAGWSVDDGYCFHDEVVCWLMDNYDGDGTPPAGSPSTFPQTRVDCDDEIPCGMWVQKDWYHIDSWTDEEVWLNLGDTLTWDGHPEDSAIYNGHIFIYGGDCPPPPPYCTIGDMKYYEGDVLPTGYVWVGQGTCTPPPPPMCDNLEMTVADAISKGYFYDEETGDCYKKVYVCKYVTTPGGNEVLQTGNNPIAVSVNALKDKINPLNVFTGVFPFAFADEQGRSIAFAWALPGTPQDEEPGLEDCLQPPDRVEGFSFDDEQVCNPAMDGTATHTTFRINWVRVAVWNALELKWELGPTQYSAPVVFATEVVDDEECIPTEPDSDRGTEQRATEVCVEPTDGTATKTTFATDWTIDYTWDWESHSYVAGPTQYGAEYVLSTEVVESEDCTPPSLDGTLFASQCIDDVPWIGYDVNLVDPNGLSTDDGTATFTFTAAGHPGETYVKTVAIGSGKFLWPGATATDNGDGTWTATNWPGYAKVGDEWVSVGNDNYGWTRDGVSVLIEVNPEMTVSLTYPPPTALCVAGPPTEIDNELDAPPATPVEAEAQFAG